ncbi:hypothetical protein C900_05179 [Fulvivirga imtechensis AK7]|uniref:Uncharacterized protein n=1 Tax=Fulvivirga imtechensis AK7 TaxID=1237149 RepID=L8JKI7_9BACT|nr:hypothetical protein [Fulvivirga imtechensis]ELR69295.1 hypothetical protein C900_05179 [Fulvivirga imtechensis AK7]
MELFTFKERDVITSIYNEQGIRDLREAIERPEYATMALPEAMGAVSYVADNSPNPSMLDLSNQFVNFQLSNSLDKPSIQESSQVEPVLKGSSEQPDVLVNLEMLSFHIGANEDIDKNSRATIRINIGKDENSRDKNFDTAFWSIAAGLNLYNQAKNKVADPKDLKSDFKQAFGNRPIEIPGGLSKMTFEVVKHREPKWWQRIFRFMQSDTGKSLISTVGFPAITSTAINMLDELLNRLDKSEPEILFKSLPLRLALSEQAKNDFTAGNPRIKMGSLNPGFTVLARGKDFETIVDSDAIFYPSYGKLVPSEITEAQLLSGRYDDPFKDVTYSIFRVGMQETKLDPSFNFG